MTARTHGRTDFNEQIPNIRRRFSRRFHMNNITVPGVLLSFLCLHLPFAFHVGLVAGQGYHYIRITPSLKFFYPRFCPIE